MFSSCCPRCGLMSADLMRKILPCPLVAVHIDRVHWPAQARTRCQCVLSLLLSPALPSELCRGLGCGCSPSPASLLNFLSLFFPHPPTALSALPSTTLSWCYACVLQTDSRACRENFLEMSGRGSLLFCLQRVQFCPSPSMRCPIFIVILCLNITWFPCLFVLRLTTIFFMNILVFTFLLFIESYV